MLPSLDETMGKQMGRGSRAFVHIGNLIWTKRMDHMIFLIFILFKKSWEMWLS
jgi:hypothetical protein